MTCVEQFILIVGLRGGDSLVKQSVDIGRKRVEKAYDVSKYRKPENPELPEFGGVKLASNDEEYLLLELLPSVANTFLKRRRAEEWEKVNGRQQSSE